MAITNGLSSYKHAVAHLNRCRTHNNNYRDVIQGKKKRHNNWKYFICFLHNSSQSSFHCRVRPIKRICTVTGFIVRRRSRFGYTSCRLRIEDVIWTFILIDYPHWRPQKFVQNVKYVQYLLLRLIRKIHFDRCYFLPRLIRRQHRGACMRFEVESLNFNSVEEFCHCKVWIS